MNLWIEPPLRPVLNPDEVHVWHAHLPSQRAHAARFAELLSADELERASRFHFDALRERAHFTRGILRLLLAHYTGLSPKEIAFTYNAHGKPALTPAQGSGLHFNLSHSGESAVWAVTRRGEVGVDIEQRRQDNSRLNEIAARYFAQGEQEQLQALPPAERTRGFFTLWARKEAFVKARGDGLFSGLAAFEVSLGEPRLLSIESSTESIADWWMSALPPLPGQSGAIVVRAPSCSPRFWQWDESVLDANA